MTRRFSHDGIFPSFWQGKISWNHKNHNNKNCAQEINPNKINFFVFDFENNHIFLIEPLFIDDQKDMTKTSIFWERKELFRWNEKRLSQILNDFHWSNIFSYVIVCLQWLQLFAKVGWIIVNWSTRNGDELRI